MIAKLRGLLDSFAADHAVVDVNGVGYLVFASTRTLSTLGPVGAEIVLHTVMQVSQDDIRLIGFASAEERDWFGLLTSVQGVGTRVALAIPVGEYATRLIKKAVVGTGGAEKAQVHAMIQRLLPGVKIAGPDAADALAVAITHAHHLASARALGGRAA